MYMGGIAGLIGTFYYESAMGANAVPIVCILIAIICALIATPMRYPKIRFQRPAAAAVSS